MQKITEEIIKELARKHSLSKVVVEEIINSMYRTIKKTIEEADVNNNESLKSIRIRGLGVFMPNSKIVKFYREKGHVNPKRDA